MTKLPQPTGRMRDYREALTRSTTDNTIYKFLKFIEESNKNNTKATQKIIRLAVLGFDRAGYFTNLFGDLRYSGLVESTYKDGYQITDKGIQRLREVEARS